MNAWAFDLAIEKRYEQIKKWKINYAHQGLLQR
jgi:hypothetical protein